MARHAARWPRGRRRHGAWQRLHVRRRRLWTGATVRPFARGGCDVHGLRGADRVRDAAGGPAMKIVFALISGTLFGFGLALSGMTDPAKVVGRSEEHTSELQSLMRISYAVFCLKKNTNTLHL